MVECHEASLELLVSHEQFAEAVEPAVADLDDPAACLLRRIAPLGISLRAATDDVRDVAVRLDDLPCTPAAIPSVCTQVFAAPRAWGLALVSDGREARLSAAKVEPTMMSVLALGFYL